MLEKTFYENCSHLCGIKKQQKILLGVSGGLDSMVLFHLFNQYKEKLGITIGVAHLNHGLRGNDSLLDQQLVKTMAAIYQVPFYTDNLSVKAIAEDKKQSIEECARICRYNFFNEIKVNNGYDLIATAHHFQDQSETVLIHLIRGSGLKGLEGMAYRREDLIRPLLNINKEAILAYGQAHDICYREDKTNEDPCFFRNRIRKELVPILKTYNNKIEDSLFRLSQIASVDNAFLEKKTGEAFGLLVQEEPEGIFFKKQIVFEDEALRKRLYKKAYEHCVKKGLEYAYIEAIDQWVMTSEGKSKMGLPNSRVLLRKPQGFSLEKSIVEKTPPYYIEATGVGTYQLPYGAGSVTLTYVDGSVAYGQATKNEGYLALDCFSWPLIIRNRRSGDAFIPLGQDKKVKVKKSLINKKIQREKRSKIPFLMDKEKGIIFVAGIGIDNRVKLTEQRSKMLHVCYKD